MKFILFYIFYEYKRKPWRCIAIGIIIGTVLFCMGVLTVLLASRGAVEPIDRGTPDDRPEARFFSANFLILLGVHALLLLTAAALLTGNKLRQDAHEYTILHDLGVGRSKLLLLQLSENTLTFLVAGIACIPLALLFMHSFTAHINHQVQHPALAYDVPAPELGIALLLLFTALLIGTAIPCFNPKHEIRFKPEGVLGNRFPAINMFRRIQRRRTRGHRCIELLVQTAVQILPLIFLLAAMSFHPLAEPAYDCSISIHTIAKQPITETVLQEIQAIDGIQVLETRADSFRGNGYYTNIKVKFDSIARESGLQTLKAMPILQQYDLIDLFHTAQTASLQNIAYRALFVQIAGILLPVSLALLFFLFLSAQESHDKNMAILYTLGANNRDIRKFYFAEVLGHGGGSSLLSIITAAVLYIIMEIEGGGTSLPSGAILSIGISYFSLMILLCIFTAQTIYRRFIRECLHKTFANRKEWYAHHL